MGPRIRLLSAAGTCVGLVLAQLAQGRTAGDQSGATYFSSYAKAVLGPLPPGSIFLINNDQMVSRCCTHPIGGTKNVFFPRVAFLGARGLQVVSM